VQSAKLAIAGAGVGILVAFGLVLAGIMEPAGVLHGDLVALLWVVDPIAFVDDLLLDAHFDEEGVFSLREIGVRGEDWDGNGA
jgi:hypothetical protein